MSDPIPSTHQYGMDRNEDSSTTSSSTSSNSNSGPQEPTSAKLQINLGSLPPLQFAPQYPPPSSSSSSLSLQYIPIPPPISVDSNQPGTPFVPPTPYAININTHSNPGTPNIRGGKHLHRADGIGNLNRLYSEDVHGLSRPQPLSRSSSFTNNPPESGNFIYSNPGSPGTKGMSNSGLVEDNALPRPASSDRSISQIVSPTKAKHQVPPEQLRKQRTASRIDPGQIPRPDRPSVDVVYHTRSSGVRKPPPTVNCLYIGIDNGNALPRHVRSTFSAPPANKELFQQIGLPFSLHTTPFHTVERGEEDVVTVEYEDPTQPINPLSPTTPHTPATPKAHTTPMTPRALSSQPSIPRLQSFKSQSSLASFSLAGQGNTSPVPPSPLGPPRCMRCKGYVNPSVTWIDSGKKWTCNLCNNTNITPQW
jgi:hypothetical protein